MGRYHFYLVVDHLPHFMGNLRLKRFGRRSRRTFQKNMPWDQNPWVDTPLITKYIVNLLSLGNTSGGESPNQYSCEIYISCVYVLFGLSRKEEIRYLIFVYVHPTISIPTFMSFTRQIHTLPIFLHHQCYCRSIHTPRNADRWKTVGRYASST